MLRPPRRLPYLLAACLAPLAGVALTLLPLPSRAQNHEWNDRRSTIACASNDRRFRKCSVPFRGRVMLLENRSGTDCIEGRNWGSGDGFVWVDGGCRGVFGSAYDTYDDAPPPPPRYRQPRYYTDPEYQVVCSSEKKRHRDCAWDLRQGRPVLLEQLSGNDCELGYSWGWEGDHIWVNNGCRARFGAR
jgi:hypothetical protein